jgi:outer membrane protein assembly factor BamB
MHRTTGVAGALVVLLSGLLIGPSAAGAVATTTWRTDGYGPGNTGYNPIETTISADTVGTLAQRWSVISPIVRDSCSRQSPPVVANNKIYLTDQGGIAAYDAATGARVWSHRFTTPADEVTPRLTVVGTRLIAALNSCVSVSDPDGDLMSFDANTGAQQWRVSRDAPMTTLVVDKDVVVVSGQDVGDPAVTAYRITDGAQLWTQTATLPRPVSANGRLLLSRYEAAGSDLVDIRTGAVIWSSPTSWTVLAAGPAGGPLFAAGPAGELARINVETGAVGWTQAGAAGQVSTDGARLYVAQGTQIIARDAATGGELWRHVYTVQLGKPVVAAGVLYVTASGARVHVLNPATGAVLDESAPYEGVVGHPVVVNGRLYVTTGRLLDAYSL